MGVETLLRRKGRLGWDEDGEEMKKPLVRGEERTSAMMVAASRLMMEAAEVKAVKPKSARVPKRILVD